MCHEPTTTEDQDDEEQQEEQPVPELEEFSDEELDDIFDRLQGGK
ncbi:MAG: hypothetical protein RLZZ387_4091 [Chloroflexota bacterium]|jgi:hypothetical protein